jgi:hypothetical protein
VPVIKPAQTHKYNMNTVHIHKTKTLNDKAETTTTTTAIIIKIIINKYT